MNTETVKPEREKTCKERVGSHFSSRYADLKKLMDAEAKGQEYVEDLGSLNEYGLSFDYVEAGTFKNQRLGYFRFQISYGGPSEEFRFFLDSGMQVYKIEFWFLDWFDGAKKTFRQGKVFDRLCCLLDYLTGGDPRYVIERSRDN